MFCSIMYWSTWAGARDSVGYIESANMDASDRRKLVSEELHWPNGLAIDYSAKKLYWFDYFTHIFLKC